MKYYSKRSSNKGFTLVELSIVLVIIGLIISSVLVGQDLIRASELRATVTQLEGFNAAVETFKVKYGGVPGDVAGATDFGFTGDGDGNGTLLASTSLAAGENVYFWDHLGSGGAALISGTYDGAAVTAATIAATLPAAKAGNYWGVFTTSGVNYYILGVLGGGSGVYLTTDTLNALDARSIDEKVDDARPYRGSVQARDGHATVADTDPSYDAGCNAAACSCGNAGALSAVAIYNTTETGTACTMRFRFQ